MPRNQPAKISKGSASAPVARSQPKSQRAALSRDDTGERDENYALVSVLYHTLQGADTIGRYIEDARRANDEELVAFFEETKEAYIERAVEAKELLGSRIASSDEEEEDEDEETEDDEELEASEEED